MKHSFSRESEIERARMCEGDEQRRTGNEEKEIVQPVIDPELVILTEVVIVREFKPAVNAPLMYAFVAVRFDVNVQEVPSSTKSLPLSNVEQSVATCMV